MDEHRGMREGESVVCMNKGLCILENCNVWYKNRLRFCVVDAYSTFCVYTLILSCLNCKVVEESVVKVTKIT
jgi:hypothetical protein